MIPKPPRTKRLWRYMNYERFVSMLERGTIYFTQPSQFEDKNEGLMSLDWQTMIALFDDGEQAHNDLTSQYPNIPSPPYISYSEWLEIFIYGREEYGVSCWHSNKSQSLAMWDLYVGKGKDGIAITTTFERLYNALIMYNSRLLIGAVEYLDLMGHKYLSHRLNERPKGVIKYHEESSSTPLDTLFRKDLSYNHENEVRAVIKLELDANKKPIQELQIQWKEIIEQVVISPYSKGYFVNEIKRVMEKSALNPDLTYQSVILDERKNFIFEKDGDGIITKFRRDGY